MKQQKAAQRDFVEENLPHNRFEVFFDVIKQRYDVLLKAGGLLLVFLLPVFAVDLIGESYYYNMINGEVPSQTELSGLKNTVAMINVGPIAIFGFGLSGVMRIIRNLIWDEPIFFIKDFVSGIRQNRLNFVLVFLVFAIIRVLIVFFSGLISNEFLKYLPAALCLAVLLPIGMYALSATVVYKDGLLSILINSVKFFIKSVPVAVLFVLILSGSFCITLIGNLIIRYVLIVVFVVILLPVFLVAWMLYSCCIFDRLVNNRLYPEYVDKGVHRIK